MAAPFDKVAQQLYGAAYDGLSVFKRRNVRSHAETGTSYGQKGGTREARRTGKPHAGDTGARPRNVVRTAAGVILTTNPRAGVPSAMHTGWGAVLKGLEARSDWQLYSVTLAVWDGSQVRSQEVYGKGGTASNVADVAGQTGGGGAGLQAGMQDLLDSLEPGSDDEGDTDATIGGDVVGITVVIDRP